ncbi:hypothetical protein FPOA_11455 [Fusarium poae]|uniref:RING-type domain-containing protein n=1 Tax=Fusarium poae TaxID=36050 RepID=A0A1B8AGV3_FUSPO|nr:hypothetical protein FPOA_11455 [Fusarium poae]
MSSRRQSDIFHQVHPDLVDLLTRLDLLSTEERNELSEASLARTIILALELADPEEQALLVSRIMPEDELAAQRLRSPEVQDTSHRVVLDREERRAAFIPDPSEPEPESNGQDCIICTERAHVRAPCGCNYCLSCYREALRIGFRSQDDFPPRCCQPFDEEAVALARSPALVHLFRQMDEERQVSIPDRIYCHDGNCAAFIPPDRKGHCLICHDRTCLDCGARRHSGQPCAEEGVVEDVWATMDATRTVNCPRCGRMIQLLEACNHITCRCYYEFCYLCGTKWKGCTCPQHNGFESMVPMRDRPGIKPPQFRRQIRRTDALASQDVGTGSLRIPQLRPNPGEEERRHNTSASRRVIRPLVLPQREEALREQHIRDRRAAELEHELEEINAFGGREEWRGLNGTQRAIMARMGGLYRGLPVLMQPGMFDPILPDPFPPAVYNRPAGPQLPPAFLAPNIHLRGGPDRIGHGHGNLAGGHMAPGGFTNPAPAMGHMGREEQHQRHEATVRDQRHELHTLMDTLTDLQPRLEFINDAWMDERIAAMQREATEEMRTVEEVWMDQRMRAVERTMTRAEFPGENEGNGQRTRHHHHHHRHQHHRH